MTRRIDNFLIIEETSPEKCQTCGEVKEVRPYGPPGKEFICYECAMNDKEGTAARFQALMLE